MGTTGRKAETEMNGTETAENRAKHTPGPWRKGRMADGSIGIHSEPFDLDTPCSEIATLTDPHGFADGVAEANARLIAAAPDLLAACKRMLVEIEHGGSNMTAIRCMAEAEGN